MSDIQGENQVQRPPKLSKQLISVRIPIDIVKELPYIAVFNHRTSTAEQVREWIVEEAKKVLNKASYVKFKNQMGKIEN